MHMWQTRAWTSNDARDEDRAPRPPAPPARARTDPPREGPDICLSRLGCSTQVVSESTAVLKTKMKLTPGIRPYARCHATLGHRLVQCDERAAGMRFVTVDSKAFRNRHEANACGDARPLEQREKSSTRSVR